MNISDNGLELIKKFEGCRLKAYKDPVGVWTIGYGHTVGVTEGMKITKAMADEYLRQDVQTVCHYVNGMDRPWTQGQFDALVSFGYNCGLGNLKKLTRGRTSDEIAKAMVKYKYAGGKVLRGLENRRREEQALFLQDVIEESKEERLVSRYVTGKIDEKKCYALNIRKEPSKSAQVVEVVSAGTEHKIDVDKSVEEYWYFKDIDGYGKKDFITIV